MHCGCFCLSLVVVAVQVFLFLFLFCFFLLWVLVRKCVVRVIYTIYGTRAFEFYFVLLILVFVVDQQRDQPGRCLYCGRAFWLYLQSHYRMRNVNVSLVGVLYAYTRRVTIALV